MKNRILATALIAASLVLIPAMAVSAHNKQAEISCSNAHVSLTAYDHTATADITVDGVVEHTGTFGSSLVADYPLSGNVEHELVVHVVSQDGAQFNFDADLVTTTCYVAPTPTPTPTPTVTPVPTPTVTTPPVVPPVTPTGPSLAVTGGPVAPGWVWPVATVVVLGGMIAIAVGYRRRPRHRA